MEFLFFVLCGLILYIYLLFPAAMALLAVAGEREERGRGGGFEPSVSFCIPAANEIDHITAKLENTLASDYPPEKLEIIVASDGSTDGTDEAVRAFGDGEVRLLSLDGGGKTRAVNELSLAAGGDVIIMSDADVLISPNAIADLVGHFADDSIGAVCGLRSSRKEGSAARHPAGIYSSYESFIKRGEGVLGRTLGGDGALYALRKKCFRPLPEHVPDDFVNILRILEEGSRVVYEKRAVSYEDLHDSKNGLFTRRRRTVARGIRGLSSVRGLLNPLRFPLTAFLICSHKVLRWGGGVLLLLALLLSLLLAARPLFAFFFVVQVAVYALSLAPPLPRLRRGAGFLRMMRYFLLSNFAATAGAVDVIFGRDWSSWKVQRVEKGG